MTNVPEIGKGPQGHNFDRLPLESLPAGMRERKQWAVAGASKAPQAPGDNGMLRNISVTEPNEWLTFDEAVAICERDAGVTTYALAKDGSIFTQVGYNVGFVFTESDPFACIDLDVKDAETDPDKPELWTTDAQKKRFNKIVEMFDSYTEVSRSGKGAHILVKGNIGKGCKRDGVEVYSQERFIICTGKVWINKPVADQQELLEQLIHEMGVVSATVAPLPSQPERESDDVLIARASNAKNAEKFTSLMNGRWEGFKEYFGDRSRADMGLVGILGFYSPNNEQCIRIFRRSGLGQRLKADRDDYVNGMVEEVRARQADEAQRKQKQREAFRHLGEDDGSGDAALPPTMDLGEMHTSLVYVAAEKPMIVGRDNHAIRLSPQGMRGLLKHNRTTIPPSEEDKKEKVVDTFDLWERSPDRLVAYTITFDPSGPEFCQSEDGRLALNLWKRRPRNPPNDWQVRATLFTDHVSYLIPIESERNRFLDWLAHIEQRPGELPHSHYLMIAVQQGIGRNLLTSILALVWSGHVAMDFDLKQSLASGFNGQLSQKLLAVVDEINEGGTGERWGHSEKLKSMLTASHRHINPKYGLQHTEKNCCRFIILTNYETGLPLTEEDRRFNVIMNPRDPRDKDYYRKLYDLITPKPDVQFIESVREYLRTRPIDGFNPGEKPPMNDAKRAVVASSMTREDEHAAEIVATHPRDLISADDLFTIVFGVDPVSAHDASRKWALFGPIATKAGLSKLPQTIPLGGRRKAKVWALRNLEKWKDANFHEIEQELKRTVDYLGQAPG